MPFVTIANVRHFYRLDGRDDRPVVMLSHSLGQDHSMWDPQAADLGNHFRVLRYDMRGHGASDVTPGDYNGELLGRDALGIAAALGIEQFAFCGLSLGGMIGQWLALNAPEKINALVLANTSPRSDAKGWKHAARWCSIHGSLRRRPRYGYDGATPRHQAACARHQRRPGRVAAMEGAQ